MTPEEINVKMRAMLEEAGYKEFMFAFIIPAHDEVKESLALTMSMARSKATCLVDELANKLPDIFMTVVMKQIEGMDVAKTEENPS